MRLLIFQCEGKCFLDRYVVSKSGHSKTLHFSTLKKKKSFVEFLKWQINKKTVTIIFCPWFKSTGRKFQICEMWQFLVKISNFCQFQVNWVMSHLCCASSVFFHLVPTTRLSFKSYWSKIALWRYIGEKFINLACNFTYHAFRCLCSQTGPENMAHSWFFFLS